MTNEQLLIERYKPHSTFALAGGADDTVLLSHHVIVYIKPCETMAKTAAEIKEYLKQRFRDQLEIEME